MHFLSALLLTVAASAPSVPATNNLMWEFFQRHPVK
jgi:hypothetical protein